MPEEQKLLREPTEAEIDELQRMMREVSANFHKARQMALNSGTCAMCGEVATGFRDRPSTREYQISGLCQSCQDEVFGE